jgi:hypothetical protein
MDVAGDSACKISAVAMKIIGSALLTEDIEPLKISAGSGKKAYMQKHSCIFLSRVLLNIVSFAPAKKQGIKLSEPGSFKHTGVSFACPASILP